MQETNTRTLWISWYPHRRTTGLCEAWGVPLHVIRSSTNGVRKWIGLSLRTVRLLHRHRPEILFVQNPSLGLTVQAVMLRRLLDFFLVVDAHNEGVRPFNRSGRFVHWLTRCLLRHADVTIVTNAALAADVSAAGGTPLVLPDRLPVAPLTSRPPALADVPQVVVISTFAPDEPVSAIFEAAAGMPDVRFAVTGDSARFAALGIGPPPNVQLTGFLPDQAYWDLLSRASVVCDLTLMPDCLVCGAYEGLALAKPMVLSENPATVDLFGAAAVLTACDAVNIANALRAALDRRVTLSANAEEVREAFRVRWDLQAANVMKAIRTAAVGHQSGTEEKLGP
jgi:glycosyltransferase involved in cell wall biosynthesis